MTGPEEVHSTAVELSDLMARKGVLGEPLEIGDKTVIPVFRYGCGFGAGQGSSGGGGGGGFGIDPIAVIIIHQGIAGAAGVQVMSLKKHGALAEAISSISEALAPQLLGTAKELMKKPGEPEKS